MAVTLNDFVNIDDWNKEWEYIDSPGYDERIKMLVLSDTLNDKKRRGEKIFFMKMPPNSLISSISKHDTFEQVLIVKGSLYWLNTDLSIQSEINIGGYVNRAPNIEHGPFKSHERDGCLMFVRLYYKKKIRSMI